MFKITPKKFFFFCLTHTHNHSEVYIQKKTSLVASRYEVSFSRSAAQISQEHSNRLDNTQQDYTKHTQCSVSQLVRVTQESRVNHVCT